MSIVLLAINLPALRAACAKYLALHGFGVVLLERPLAPLSLAAALQWDAALLDESSLGRGAVSALALTPACKLIGIGFRDPRLHATIDLPLQADDLASTLERLLYAESGRGAQLSLDPRRRMAYANGREVSLTRTEFLLLQLLNDRRPADVTLRDVLITVWGSAEGRGTSDLVRSHLRNLRRKLAGLGLPEAIRSYRGLGYRLEL